MKNTMRNNFQNTGREVSSGNHQVISHGDGTNNIMPVAMERTSEHRLTSIPRRFISKTRKWHRRTPYLCHLPLAAISIISSLVLVNLMAWTICSLVLTRHPHLLSTAALAYSLGLRHALDADHISAIDLMTRRLVASGQRPVTVGTFFSLGHSTIVVVTSIVVAATAAGVSHRFDGFSKVGGIVGSSVSASFLILLGIMNIYILYRLLTQLKKVVHLQPEHEVLEGLKIEGGGVLFRILKKMFKLIDRPWKMYPLGVLFGLGFDTSSEVALLGISSIQGVKGTSMWLILIFPVLFTVGMCLVDTIDGALMMSLYIVPVGLGDISQKKIKHNGNTFNHAIDDSVITTTNFQTDNDRGTDEENLAVSPPLSPSQPQLTSINATATETTHPPRVKSPLTFLYYSSVLTFLTVIVALVIGTIQLLTLILNVAVSDEAATNSPFWTGVARAGDYYDIIGGAIYGAFIVFGLVSVACYRPWRRWVDRVRERERPVAEGPRSFVGTVELARDHNINHNIIGDTPGTTHLSDARDSNGSANAPKEVRSEVHKVN